MLLTDVYQIERINIEKRSTYILTFVKNYVTNEYKKTLVVGIIKLGAKMKNVEYRM